MRHRVKKIKFSSGRDAAVSIMRHLAVNFIKNGKLETTITKARYLKSALDRLVYYAKMQKTKAQRILLRRLNSAEAASRLVEVIAPAFGDRQSGFTTLIKTRVRLGDGALMARVEWTVPVEVTNKEKKNDSTSHQSNKTN